MKIYKHIIIVLISIAVIELVIFASDLLKNDNVNIEQTTDIPASNDNTTDLISIDVTQKKQETMIEDMFPMAIHTLRKNEYPGSNFLIEKTLTDGSNYQQFIASYRSEGLKIFGLLTIPKSPKPEKGYPAVIFVHGYISPGQYSTTGSYPTYQASLARGGFATFKPDLRGHGQSEGEAVSAHFSEKYVIDTMYAISYLKNYLDIDPERIGYWGHSNGGEIGLRVAIISTDIKAASFWAGVVGSYEDMFETTSVRLINFCSLKNI